MTASFSCTTALGPGPACDILKFPDVAAISSGNMKLIPCPDMLHALPWVTQEKFRVGEILCETRWTADNPQEVCPRYIARKQLERMRDHGYTLTSGWEFEFMLMDGVDKEPVFKGLYAFSNFKFADYEPV